MTTNAIPKQVMRTARISSASIGYHSFGGAVVSADALAYGLFIKHRYPPSVRHAIANQC